MTFAVSRMDAAQFAQVASKCRWSERSLEVARALIIDDLSLSEAAAATSMSPQQAQVIRTRFLAKAEKIRFEDFMQCERPKLSHVSLDAFSTEMKKLRENGYSIKQIVAFLKENGVSMSQSTVRIFVRGKRV